MAIMQYKMIPAYIMVMISLRVVSRPIIES
jgi:hypothetical protein